MNILDQIALSQVDNLKEQLGITVTYNDTTITALLSNNTRTKEQTGQGTEDFDEIYISVFKSDVASVKTNEDKVVYSGVTYAVISVEDGSSMHHLRLLNRTVTERTGEGFRRSK